MAKNKILEKRVEYYVKKNLRRNWKLKLKIDCSPFWSKKINITSASKKEIKITKFVL